MNVPSPCNGICRLDKDRVCVGCHRTAQEIATWGVSPPIRRLEILALAKDRLASQSRDVGRWNTRRGEPESTQVAGKPNHTGFTLVELLVVLSVIGALLSLLLPAVQMAREASRKSTCQNHLRQIGLGLHAYHGTHQSLPVGCLEWRRWGVPRTHRQFAWSAMLLPFLEQRPLHERIDFNVPFDDPRNASAAAGRVPVYLCPTSPERRSTMGPTDYGGLYGERLVDRRSEDGVFLYDRLIRFRDVLDGLSSTMAVAEDVGGPDAFWIDGRNVFEQAFGINDPRSPSFDNEIRSAHPGGAMVLFTGGNVTFLTDSIDRRVLGALITRANGETVNLDELSVSPR